MRHLVLFFFLLLSVNTFSQNLSNKGREFWVGYGHNNLFSGGGGVYDMVLYLSADQTANVTVTLNSTGAVLYSGTIPGGSVVQTPVIPRTGINDSRLQTEGLSNKGIHIVSDVPIVAYAHQYGQNSSGATMLLPVETYGNTYYSLNYTQKSNANNSYSWFFVVASEDNTKVEITPSVNTSGGQQANVAFTVSLNKGEIYNVFGALTGSSNACTGGGPGSGNVSTGYDLTGSKIQSVLGIDRVCHPIGVFSGASRMVINGTSGDIMQQQIFPASAWGTKYLTYCTVNTDNINTVNQNIFRVAVRDPSTVVKRNGTTLTNLLGNFYYEFTGTSGDYIEADKPILVSQYIPSQNNCPNTSFNGDGDPEMFYLSPLEQAISSATFYNTGNQNITSNYVCIIVDANADITIDGSYGYDVQIPHPQNGNYQVLIKQLSTGPHTIESDSTFIAMTYGFGQVESYGYNAGTMINNLEFVPAIKNILGTGSQSPSTCPNTPFKVKVDMPFQPSKIVFKFSKISKLVTNYDTTLVNPVPDSSYVNGSRTFYQYRLPRDYYITDTGSFNIPIDITAPQIDNCDNTVTATLNVLVKAGPVANFTYTYSGCLADTAKLQASGASGYSINRWLWQFDDGTTSTISNPQKTFATIASHPVKLTVYSTTGCIGDTTKPVVTSPPPVTKFGISPLPACEGSTLTFTDTSVFGGTYGSWYWDFGNGQTLRTTTANPVTNTYNTAGIFTVKHVVNSSGSCKSDTVSKSLQIFAKPVVNFGYNAGCAPNSTVSFHDSTSISDNQALNYSWNFGDPNASAGNPNTSTSKNPTHQYSTAGNYSVTLTVTTANGCSDQITKIISVVTGPVASFTVNNSPQCLGGNSFVFTNTSNGNGSSFTSSWFFGDAGTSTSTDPVHSYAVAGTYIVKLIITTSNGCKDSTTTTVIVNPAPVAAFSVNSATQCLVNNNFVFTNTSSGATSYSWTFGDGNVSTAVSPSHTYAATGTYTVKLVATTANGCKDSTQTSVTVSASPVSGFNINNPVQCSSGNVFAFTNTSTATGTPTYQWYFGDGGTSSATNPSHSYTSAGTYSVKLVVSLGTSCKDSTTKTVTVNPSPIASFTVNNAAQCFAGNSFVFTNTSTISSGTVTYAWNFGNGSTSTQTSPTYSYPAPGTYTVTLIATSNTGCKDTTTQSVTVNPKPVAAFTVNTTAACLGTTFNFTNTSTVSSGTLSYQWLYGDGGTSTAVNPIYSYTTAGTYTVKLIVISNAGCKDSITNTITVNPKPVASFTVNNATQCFSGNSFVFTNTSSVSSGTITYLWNFGNGATSTQTSPTYSYPAAGTFTVKLVVTSNAGCKDSVTQTVTVSPKPVAAFTVNTATACLGTTFNFTNNSTVSSGTLSYQWLFGDGGTSAAASPTYTYTTAGTYTVKFIVTSNAGCKDSVTKTITVNPKPAASFTVNNATQCLSGNSFVFTNTSTISNGTMTYLWNFGNGSTSTQTNPTYPYPVAGTYTVRLIATSDNGCKDTSTMVVTVNPKPVASFTVNASNQCLNNNSFTFTSTSTGAGSYLWSFGDGNTSSAINPAHSYTATGSYIVKLIVTTAGGCKDSTQKTVTVSPMPVASFTVNDSSQCLSGNRFAFTNTSSISSGTINYLWTFGDGGTATTANPAHIYTSAGTYIVKLVATSGNGCKDSASQTINVYATPVASFTISSNGTCANNNSFTFTSTSTSGAGTLSYSWNFGNGVTSTQTSPSYSYPAAGTYTVKLVAVTSNGCKDSVTHTVTVSPKPVAAFSINNANQCLGNTYTFTNSSTVAGGTLTYIWSFGDSGTSAAATPSYNYTTAGTYTVKLVVTSNAGCKDSISKKVTVYPKPVAAFTVNNAVQCNKGNSFTFTNTSAISSGTMTYKWSFGNGVTSTQASPTYTYPAAGTYTVKLVVTSDNGCQDSVSQTVTVNPDPVAAFTVNNRVQCFNNNSFVFTNTSSISGGTISYQWTFGDGSNSTQTNPVHTYAAAGTYIVKLVVTSAAGCKDSTQSSVTVNPSPMAAFAINNAAQCLNNNSFAFTNTSTISSGTVTYLWSFGDGGTATTTDATHNYTAAGTYTVKLVATSDNGCKDSVSHTVTVNPKPRASFNVNNGFQCLNGNNYVFTNNSTLSSGTMTYSWNFGDGGTSTDTNPSHVYTAAGTYTVRLIVTSDLGCIDSVKKTLRVDPSPVSSFTINTASQCLNGNSFTFTNTSSLSSGTMSYVWSFGDGGTATTTDASHTYAAAGTYTVKLVATSNNGCKDSVSQTVTVSPKPRASFSVNNAFQCVNTNNYVFTNNSTLSSGTMTYSWSFGDGGTSTDVSPSHVYATAGTYTVRLVVTSDLGCIDSLKKTIRVDPKPAASFTVNNASQCMNGNSFVFTNTTTPASSMYSWTFGDGGTSTQTSPSHSYAAAGTYTVTLIATNVYGCMDTAVTVVTVNAMPAASFTVNSNGQCFNNNNFIFTNTTTDAGTNATYLWSFGDGATAATANASHSYAASGTYTVKLVVITAAGCKDSTTQTVTIYPQPSPSFTVNDADQCLNGNNFVFTNTSTISSGTLSYQWTFGDGGTSTQKNPSHVYLTAGTYTVKLRVSPGTGCTDSTATATVTVYPKPAAAFNINNNAQCLNGNSFVFTNTSTPASGVTYSWSFGDGGTSSQTDPTYTYTTAGTYAVKLVVTTTNGCKDSVTQSVTVYPKPVASFTVNNSSQCISGNSFTFTNTSTVTPGTFTSVWTFGDATSSTSKNPTHTYTSAGTYTVKLVITSDNGCKDSATTTVTVTPKPSVSFTVNNSGQCVNNNSFTFTNTSTVSSGTMTYVWSFGDGGTATTTDASHTYTTAGTYTVKLVASSSTGCKDSAVQTITVYPKPTASFTVNTAAQCVTGNSFTFTNTSTISSGTMTYSWMFGDGGTATTTDASHTYAAAGTYTVKLVVTSGNGCKDSTTRIITVNAKPVASFTINSASQCLNGNSFTFTNTSTLSSGTMSYVWSFGDGGTATTTDASHTYAAAGTYTVKLVVTSDNGCKDSVSQTVTVSPKPRASFSVNNAFQCVNTNNYVFTNNSTLSSGTMTYSWSFGDGGTSTDVSPSHVYATAGTYTVRLIVTSDLGCIDSLKKTIRVDPKPAASFTVNNASQCMNGNSFVFTNTTTPASSTYSWTFGDGGTSTQTSPSHSYAAAGTYTVTLIATNVYGCMDTAVTAVTVNAMPAASFTVNSNGQCFNNNNFLFTNTTTDAGTNATYSWSFGDGATAATANASHSYAASGTYTVKLVVITAAGCKDSTTQTVTIYPQPSPSFTVNDADQCLNGNNFVFTNTSTISSGILSYQWTFGDGGTSTQKNPSHVYLAAGTYTVKLRVSPGTGCTDSTATATVTVYPKPTAAFSINNNAQCLNGNSFVFTNTSTPASGVTYSWSFGDGGTSSQTNPSYVYTAAGTYSVKLVVSTTNGCKDSVVQSVTVYPKPVASFTVNNSSQCISGNSFTFVNTSTVTPGTFTSFWTFGDGVTSTSKTPTRIYTLPGTYTVKLVITSDNGCKDSATTTVTVTPKPSVSFTVNNSGQCVNNNSFTFTNTSTVSSGTMTYVWSFGDGGTATTTDASHTYTTAGTYTVKLVASSSTGCKDSAVQTITVYPKPTASFTVNTAAQCVTGNSFTFTNTSTISSGTMTYNWSFGDGGTATTTDASHTYAAAGTYTVKLVVTSDNGCKDSTTRIITVNAKPVASFTINSTSQCLSGNSFTFTNTSTLSSGTMTYSWSFGDGGTATTTDASHTYAAAGTYTVKLVVTSDNGCKDSVSQTVTVSPKPTAGFTVNTTIQCFNNNSYTFTNTSTISGSTMTYLWTFGDGGVSTVTNPQHSYASAGTYTVKLVVTSAEGCKDSIAKTITVNPSPAVAFSVNSAAQCFSGNSFVFTNSSSISSGTITYRWTFGDGGTATTTNATHTYAVAGSYTVKLVVTSDSGCKDSVAKTIVVNPSPIAGFTINAAVQCFNNNSYTFTNTSTISGSTMTYSWTFGDGGVSTVTNPQHSYASAGTYTVKLVVTSAEGCKDSITKTITVNPKPTAGFTINNSQQCLNGNSFAFINTSTVSSGNLSYQWNFGNGATSTSTSPVYIYTSAGTYNVKLIVTSNNGCTDSITKTITVFDKPNVSFIINNAGQCLNSNSFTFTNTSTIGAGTMTYYWTFGNGATSTIANPTYTYTTAGTYTVKLVVTSNNGCKDSTAKTITVFPKPTAGFTINNAGQCLAGNSYIFTNTSTVSTGTLTYAWTFGDGGASSAASPNHAYAAAGTYTVKLIATAANGCKDSALKQITVYPKPVAGFTINNNAQCANGNSFVFTNTSTISSGTITYSWTFGNGNTSAATNPTVTYNAAGTYTVKLIVTSNNGCKDSTTKTVTVYPKPTASYAVNNVAQCFDNNSFTFTNMSTVSTGALTYAWTFGDGTKSASTSPTHAYPNPGVFSVKLLVTTINGCKDSIQKNVTVYPNMVVVVQDTVSVCKDSTATFTVKYPVAGVTYNWFKTATGGTPIPVAPPGTTFFVSNVTADTSFYVEAVTPAGCTASARKKVSALVLRPLAAPVIRIDTANIGANMITFKWQPVPGAIGYQVAVNNGSFTIPSSGVVGLSHTVTGLTPFQTVTINVRAIAARECQSSEAGSAKGTTRTDQVFIPNTFTPNGDGQNDLFKVYSNAVKEMQFMVFNQYGQKLFETTNMSDGWDGTYRGSAQPVGVYIYAARFVLTDGSTIVKKGSLNLVR